MTKKDYIKFALMIKKFKSEQMDVIGLSRLTDELGFIFERDNPRFQWSKWLEFIDKKQ